jgi:hypothetical protein
MTVELLLKIAQIIAIDIVLSGDNAVVIAMAAHRLPETQRKWAILGGGGIAIILRILFTMMMAILLMVPGVRLIGGIVLVWIQKDPLQTERERHEEEGNQWLPLAFAQPELIAGKYGGEHDGKFLGFVSQPKGHESKKPATMHPGEDAQQTEGGTEKVKGVHGLPVHIEDRHLEGEEESPGAGREIRESQAPEDEPDQPHIEEMEQVEGQ